MLQILVNKQPVALLQPVKDIQSLIIVHYKIPIIIPAEQVQPIAQWLYDIAQKAEIIMYNNIIMTKDQVLSPTEIINKRREYQQAQQG